MRNPGPSIQVKEAIAALKAIGFKRKDFRVERTRVHTRAYFLIRPVQVLPLVDEMATAGFRVNEIVMDGKVVNVTARWLNGRPGYVSVDAIERSGPAAQAPGQEGAGTPATASASTGSRRTTTAVPTTA